MAMKIFKKKTLFDLVLTNFHDTVGNPNPGVSGIYLLDHNVNIIFFPIQTLETEGQDQSFFLLVSERKVAASKKRFPFPL